MEKGKTLIRTINIINLQQVINKRHSDNYLKRKYNENLKPKIKRKDLEKSVLLYFLNRKLCVSDHYVIMIPLDLFKRVKLLFYF